jgi:outer membrane protein OmpA-like peptidoglycan-associated protein/tetratricopeptide (TPR) repeat protein
VKQNSPEPVDKSFVLIFGPILDYMATMRYLVLIIAAFLSLNSLAQPGPQYSIEDKKATKKYEEAMTAYDLGDVSGTISKLMDLVEKYPTFIEPHLLLAQIYGDTKQMDLAITWLEKGLTINERFFVDGWLTLAQCEQSIGNYTAAEKAATKYIQLPDNSKKKEDLARLILSSCAFAQDALQHPVPFEPKNLGNGVNTEQNEYYPCVTADGNTLLFTRLIKDAKAYNGRQEDFYVAQKKGENWSDVMPINEINTPLNEGAPTLSPDGQVIIFTACEDIEGNWGGTRQGVGSCDLFYAYKRGNVWVEPQNLGQSINTYGWESQPSFAADGRTLYFVRGKYVGGSIKEQDIFVSYLGADGSWSKPALIEGRVNTAYEEESVMIHPDGKTLFFSSNGHSGMGGLDIFMSRMQPDGTWGKPVNLGYPINTFKDENSLLVSSDGELAFFASDREGGFGGLDLYSFELYDEIRPASVTYVRGIVSDAVTSKNLEAKFDLIDLETGKTVVESYSNALSGEFLICIPGGKDYALNVNKKSYLFHSENFSLKNYNRIEPYQLDVKLQPIKDSSRIVLNNIFFETNSYLLLPASEVELNKLYMMLTQNADLKIEIGGHTDNVGSDEDNQKLSEKRAAEVVAYLVKRGIDKARLTYVGYGEKSPIDTNDTEAGRAKNRRTELRVI